LLQDGLLTAAAQEERFTRRKNDRAFPRSAFRYCLEQTGLSISDIDCIAYYEDSTLKLGRQLWMAMLPEVVEKKSDAILRRVVAPSPADSIMHLLGYDGRIEVVDHHLSHAASAYFFSGFHDAAILTVDGVGEWATTTYNSAQGSQISRLEEVVFPHSLGFFYSAITGFLGFEVNEGEYKVMGLAPYGTPAYVDRLRTLIASGPYGQYQLDMTYFGFLSGDCMYTDRLASLLGHSPRSPGGPLSQFHHDLARSAQVVLEEVLLEKTRYLHSLFPTDNLCMAGGVALNVVANSRCLREGPFKRLFVQPAAGDAGGSVGAAAVAHVRLTGSRPRNDRLRHVYLGPSEPSSEIFQILKASSATFEDFRGQEHDLLCFVADALSEGKVVGWLHGRMEFGPRALGARSILADPRRPEMRDRVNSLVKMREAFRPFAPAVLESEVRDHFEIDHPSPFMLETCQVRSALSLPAITHVDNSARIQTVDDDSSPRFAALLREFHRRTGCPILLNSSFNLRGEPIVCSALDAITCFVNSQIDVLVLEDFVLLRAGIPPLWEAYAKGRLGRADDHDDVGHLVYTLL
jgi:carbamoyltransferase